MALNLTDAERNTEAAQTMIQHIEYLRKQSKVFEDMNAPVLAQVFKEAADSKENEVNSYLKSE